MAKGKNSGPSNRAMGETIILMCLIGLVGLEMHLVFKGWWTVWGLWINRNFVTPILLCIGMIAGPVTIFMAMKSSGKRIGDEAEEIRRGMRR